MRYLSNVFSKKHREKELSLLKDLGSVHPDMAVFSIVKIQNILILSNLYKEYKSETGFCLRKDSNFKSWFESCIFPLISFASLFAFILLIISDRSDIPPFLFYGLLICFSIVILGFVFATCLLSYTFITKIIIVQYNASDSNKEIIINALQKMHRIKYTEEKDKIMKVVELQKKSDPDRRKRL